MNPPDNAVVLCVDEKSQIQALNRTQPMLPLRPEQAARGTPEYQRNGTTSSSRLWTRPLATSSASALPATARSSSESSSMRSAETSHHSSMFDIIVDNYATHSAPTIKRWLANNPRFALPLHPHVLLLAQPSEDQFRPGEFDAGRPLSRRASRRPPSAMEG